MDPSSITVSDHSILNFQLTLPYAFYQMTINFVHTVECNKIGIEQSHRFELLPESCKRGTCDVLRSESTYMVTVLFLRLGILLVHHTRSRSFFTLHHPTLVLHFSKMQFKLLVSILLASAAVAAPVQERGLGDLIDPSELGEVLGQGGNIFGSGNKGMLFILMT